MKDDLPKEPVNGPECGYCGRPKADDEEMCDDCRRATIAERENYGGTPSEESLKQAHREDMISSTPRGMANGG